jgi:hypothetical protein
VLSSAVATGVLVEESGDRYAIHQTIVREVLDASLSHLVRARWEARIASVLGHDSSHLTRPGLSRHGVDRDTAT